MGNCINLPSKKTVKVLVFNGVFNGVEEEFKARTTVAKITTGPYEEYAVVNDAHPHLALLPEAKLKSSEVYYLIPCKRHHCIPWGSSKWVNNGSQEGQKVKIVVTKQQLEFLLKNAKEFRSRIALQFLKDQGGYQKWRPHLATIPEL